MGFVGKRKGKLNGRRKEGRRKTMRLGKKGGAHVDMFFGSEILETAREEGDKILKTLFLLS